MPESTALEAGRQTNEENHRIIKEIDTALATARKAFVKPANAAIARLSTTGQQWDYPLAFALLENMKAQQVAQEPSFIAHPRNPDGEMLQPVIEKLLNHYAAELDFRQMAEEASDWVGWTGLAVAKVGYTLTSDAVEPWAYSFDPRNFFVDTYCTKTDLSDARYCGDVRELTKTEALNDQNYDPVLANEIPVNRIGSDYIRDDDNRFGRETGLPDRYGLIRVREMALRDPETGLVNVGAHAEGQSGFVREFRPMPEVFRAFNYVPLVFFPVCGNFYGQSILSKVEATCELLDKALKRIRDRWERAPEKYLVNERMLEQGGLDKLRSSAMFDFIGVRDGSARDAVHFLHEQIIYNDEMVFLRYLVELFQWISGMTYMQLGSGSSRTATEAGLVGQSSDMRSMRRMSVMERWMSGIGYRLWVILRYQRDFIPYREILGQELAAAWDEYETRQSDRERLRNDTDISVRMSEPINAAAIHRRDKNLEFLRRAADPVIMQALGMQGLQLDVATILNGIARDTGFHKPITIEMQQPMPQEGE